MAARGVERLLNVIMTIGSRRRIDRAKLFAVIPDYAAAKSADAVERMFERDKAAILDLGLPLVTETDVLDENTVYYRIDTAGADAVLDVTTEEYTVLLAASRAWDDAAAGGAARRVRAKLLSLGHDADPDLLRRTPRGAVESLPVLSPLLEAVTSARAVSFTYRSASGAPSTRVVEPWIVGVHEGYWYIHGWDRDRGAPRVFRASRIESFPTLGTAAAEPRPEGLDLAAVLEDQHRSDDRATARITAAPYKALALRDRAGAELDVTGLTLPELPRPAARRLLLGESRWIELREPRAWRDELAEVLGAIAALHEGPADLSALEAATPRPPTRIRTSSSGTDHLSRLLGVASHVMAKGESDLAELAGELGITEKQLIDDLQVLFLCGDLGNGWEDLIEAEWEQGTVRVRNAEPLRRALRLSPVEVTALLAGIAALEPAAGETEAILDSARTKLLAAAGLDTAPPSTPVPAATEPAAEPAARADPTARRGEEVLAAVQHSLHTADPAAALTIRYSGPDRPGTSVRRIRPLRIETTGSRSYLRAHCELAGAERRFRLDRIVEILPEGTPSARSPEADAAPGPDLRGLLEGEVWVRLSPPARWIAESFSAAELRDGADGSLFARLPEPLQAALIDAVLETAGGAEVLSPDVFRNTIVTVTRAAEDRHTQHEALR